MRGERREITFYAAARLDGLQRREEVFGCKLTEHFVGRDDHLVYRSATFGAGGPAGAHAAGPGSAQQQGLSAADAGGLSTSAAGAGGEALGHQQLVSAAGYGLPSSQQQQQQQARALPVLKMTQKFERDPSKPADADVSKQVFHLAEGKTLVQFHHASDRLTAGHLLFHKDGPAQAVQVGAEDKGISGSLTCCRRCSADPHE